MQNSYESLIEKMVASSSVPKEELERKIEARRAKLSGLISKEGAAQIIAAEMGINFDNTNFKVSELVPGMKKVNVVVKVLNVFPVRSFDKNGKSGKVANLIVADETGSCKLVLWDTNHIALIENGDLLANSVIEVRNGSVREGEIHLSGFSEIKKSSANIGVVKVERTFSEKTIDSIQEGNSVSLRGLVVQVYSPRFFFVCSQCNKKVVQDADGYYCSEHNKVGPKERALLNIVIDDGTETLRSVLFSDQLEKLTTIEKLKDPVAFGLFKDELMGTEFNFKGNVKKNSLFNVVELSIQDMEKVDVEKLAVELER